MSWSVQADMGNGVFWLTQEWWSDKCCWTQSRSGAEDFSSLREAKKAWIRFVQSQDCCKDCPEIVAKGAVSIVENTLV